jgi:hypothetical protein
MVPIPPTIHFVKAHRPDFNFNSAQSGSGSNSLQGDELLARIIKAQIQADENLARLFGSVAELTGRLIGDMPVAGENLEPHPPAPGALNELLWRAETHLRHLAALEDRLATLHRAL